MHEGKPAGSEKDPAAEAVRVNSSNNNDSNRRVLTHAVMGVAGEAAEVVLVVRRVGSRAVMFAGVLGILPKTARTRRKTYDIVPSLKYKTDACVPGRI